MLIDEWHSLYCIRSLFWVVFFNSLSGWMNQVCVVVPHIFNCHLELVWLSYRCDYHPNFVITLYVGFILQVVYSGKELNHPFGISHYHNFIFWTEYMNASVFQLDLNTGDVTLLRSERPPLFGLRVFDAQIQQGWLLSLHLLLSQCHWTVASLTERVAVLYRL